MRRRLHMLALLAAVVHGPAANGTITIETAGGVPATPEQATKVLNPATGGWDIDLIALYAPGGDTSYTVRGNGGEVIDNVFIDVPCWTDPDGACVTAGSPVTVRILSEGAAGIAAIHNVEQRGTAETFLLDVQARVDIGSVSAEVIGTVVAGRDVVGPIVATTADNPARGIFWVEAQRDILGDVITANGRIGRVWAYRNMGTPDTPIRIEARHFINGIFAAPGACVTEWLSGAPITCAGEVYANVNTRVNGGNGYIFRFLAGSFSGSFETRVLYHDVATGTPGSIAVTEAFDASLVFGRSLNRTDQSIELPSTGFSGQITVNADNVAGAVWVTPVHLGAANDPARVTISGPGYEQTAADLGGGSIGLVPFGLHSSSCTPPAGGSAAPGDVTVALRHYGPVAVAGPDPVLIQRRPAGSPGSWSLLPGAAFVVTPAPGDPNTILVASAPDINGFEEGYEYRLTATSDLVCVAPGDPPVAWDGPYTMTVDAGAACTADLNGDGAVGMPDLFVLIALWGPGYSGPADLDGDGEIGFGDILVIFGAWGPC